MAHKHYPSGTRVSGGGVYIVRPADSLPVPVHPCNAVGVLLPGGCWVPVALGVVAVEGFEPWRCRAQSQGLFERGKDAVSRQEVGLFDRVEGILVDVLGGFGDERVLKAPRVHEQV